MEKPNTVIIKKYSDRRLYDTAASRYVKLNDIALMIRSGADVEVVDARTGKDLTRVILTEIVVEDARDRDTGLPMQFLRQLVVASDRATHEFLSWYLNGTLELYKKAQEMVHSRISEARQVVTSPLDFVRHVLGQAPPAGSENGEVEQLRQRIAELEARLAQAGEPARPARKRARRKAGGPQ